MQYMEKIKTYNIIQIYNKQYYSGDSKINMSNRKRKTCLQVQIMYKDTHE